MELNWIQSIVCGLVSGLADILPVSGHAHRIILMNLFGLSDEPVLMRLFIHIGTLAGLYYSCQNQLIRMVRAIKLARIPKRRRKRPLDTMSLMDVRSLEMMLIPMVPALIFAGRAYTLAQQLVYVAVFLFLNGLILYVPRYLPGSDKDARGLSRMESIFMGLGGAASVLPGISTTGAVRSVATVCGANKQYALNIALLAALPMFLGLVITDIVVLFSGGAAGISFLVVLEYIVSGIAAFGGALLGVKLLKLINESLSPDVFTFYNWGAALFAFILFLNI